MWVQVIVHLFDYEGVVVSNICSGGWLDGFSGVVGCCILYRSYLSEGLSLSIYTNILLKFIEALQITDQKEEKMILCVTFFWLVIKVLLSYPIKS